MDDFPALEVVTNGGAGLRVGKRLPITATSPFVIGRRADSSLQLRSGKLAPRHCEVVFEQERWWVRDLGSTHGTFHLGERIRGAALSHGEVFELPSGAALRLLLQEPNDVRDAQMERAIAEQPDDEDRWSVYADWLQERGAPLGERLANPLPAHDRRWLGPLACYAARGELEVNWAHGLPARVVLRAFSEWHRMESFG